MQQKSILITGCSSGIGHDAALGMRERGWRVFASCRKEADCQMMRELGFESPRIDYQDGDSIRDGLGEVLAATGGTLDAVFNNGAFGLPGAVEDLPVEGLREIFDANFFGWHDLTRQIIPVMRTQGYGRIVMNSSVLGFLPFHWRASYVATKYALEGYSDVLRLELSPANIQVILIEPGPIPSNIRANSIPHFEKWIDWENSALSEFYRKSLIKRLYAGKQKPDPFELPASAVTDKLALALESERPRARYRVTRLTQIAWIAKRLLPTRTMDYLISRR